MLQRIPQHKLHEMLEKVVETLSKQGLLNLSNVKNPKELDKLIEDIVEKMLEQAAKEDMALTPKPGYSFPHDLIFRFLKAKQALDENSEEAKTLKYKLDQAIMKLKSSATKEELHQNLQEVLKLLRSMSPELKAAIPEEKIKSEAAQIAETMEQRFKQQAQLSNEDREAIILNTLVDELTNTLRQLYGGTDPRTGGTVVTISCVIGNLHGLPYQGQASATSNEAMAADNRYDFKADSGGRENTVLQNLISAGAPILETIKEAGLMRDIPAPTPQGNQGG